MPQSAKQREKESDRVRKIEPNSQKFLKQYDAELVKRLEEIAGDLLNELGYTTIYAIGSKDVGYVRSKLIRFTDFLKANQRLWGKITGRRNVSWRRVYRSTLASIREYSSKKY
jgi:hypothetical protein